jgi:hypothetical protein
MTDSNAPAAPFSGAVLPQAGAVLSPVALRPVAVLSPVAGTLAE